MKNNKTIFNHLPIELSICLNEFNQNVEIHRDTIRLKAEVKQVTVQKELTNKYIITYNIVNTDYLFEISYIPRIDSIGWKYGPYSKETTKKRVIRLQVISPKTYDLLRQSFSKWKSFIIVTKDLENPFDFWDADKYIKFYSAEIIEDINITEEEENEILPSKKQEEVITRLKQQTLFLEQVLTKIEDKSSIEYNDLSISKDITEKLADEIPRMSIAEIKRNWAFSLGAIQKWCGKRFKTFAKLDSNNANDISRTLGSFIGGILGIPKLVE